MLIDEESRLIALATEADKLALSRAPSMAAKRGCGTI